MSQPQTLTDTEAATGWPAHRRVLAISFPAILANSSAPLVGLVDTWAIGHLPGAVHLAAVGLGSVIFSFIFWAFGFLRMGTTGLVAQAWGRGDEAQLGRVVVRGCALGLLTGVLMWLIQMPLAELSIRLMAAPDDVARLTRTYFDIRIWAAPATLFVFVISGALFGLGRTSAVLILQLVLNLTNGVLNLWLVVGLDMGVAGVALGTVLAQWVSAALAIWLLLKTPGLGQSWTAIRDPLTWALARFRSLVLINGFIFLRTILLMIALALIMRQSATLGETSMATSHVINQYLMLIALGLDGFAHAAEALAGAAWGHGRRREFQRWVVISGFWAVLASFVYSVIFWLAGDAITHLLTDLESVRVAAATVMPVVIALPLVSVWCYHFDGVYIGATAVKAMFFTMALAFVIYLMVLGPMTRAWGLQGLWSAVLVFMALRGVAQALWYPRMVRQLKA